MTLFLCVSGGILLALSILTGWLYSRSKPKIPVPGGAITTTTNGDKKTRTYSWEKIRDAWFSAIAFAVILLCWYLVSPDSMRKATSSNEFVAGLILVVTSQLVLSAYAPFKENRLRKLLLFIFFVGGVFMLVKDAVGFDAKHIGQELAGNLSTTSASSEGLSQQRKLIEIEVASGKWTNKKLTLPSGVHFDCDFPGQWIDWRFQNGTIVRRTEDGGRFIVDENGKVIRRFSVSDKLPRREFYVRSPVAGTVSFTIL